MRLVPDSNALTEYNTCHAPAGSSAGGQFCSKASGGVSTARDDTPEYGAARGLTQAMSAKEYAKAYGISETTARKRLDAMVQAGTARWSMGSHRQTSRFRDVRDHVSTFKVYRPIDVAKDDTPEYGSGKTSPKAFVDELFKLGQRSPIDPREVVLDAGNGGYAIIEPRPFDDHVYLTAFRTTAQGKGHGTAVMQMLTDLADKQGVTLRLVASSFNVSPPLKKTPKARLIKFYGRHGFTSDPEYTRSSGHMIRKPR